MTSHSIENLNITSKQSSQDLEPFLKWAGGKRWLVQRQIKLVPNEFNRYVEPFLGGAAVFFSLPNTTSILSDSNQELIDCYQAIQSNYKLVEKYLRKHQRNHSDEYYYQVREYKPRQIYTKAARFLYLNRTCWNGLYRVNLNGKFNVPRGTKNSVILDTDNFELVAQKLKSAKILCQDFEQTLAITEKGDFAFIDPPYTANHNLNGFLKYNKRLFRWRDQERLKDAISCAVDRGVQITMTNADHESIHELYSDMCEIERIERKSVIAGNTIHRGQTSEVLMRIGWRT